MFNVLNITFLLLSTIVVAQSYVSIPAATAASRHVLTLHNFTTTTGAHGRVAVVHRPIGHFHVYYPLTSSGQCDGLELTSQQSGKHNCEFATNGGPFSYKSPTCIGNIVSDGKIIQTAAKGDKSIGLTSNGTWIIGEVTEADVKKLSFTQLTSGFNWLTKDGKIVPAAGGEIAPRTFAGINPAGELLLFVVDGHEKPALGLTLQQTAEIAKKWGCDYSLNLDGGGSTVACNKYQVISKPTCVDIPYVCERKVTTITCITL